MAKTQLTIRENKSIRQVELNPKGAIIGRGPQCDIVLHSKHVSREHARIFRDPFGRWIIKDLGSSNGIFIHNERVEGYAVLSDEPVAVGTFFLTIKQPIDEQALQAAPALTTANVVVEDFETEIIAGKSSLHADSHRPGMERIEKISDHLSELTSPSMLYPEVCRFLSSTPKTAAMILRVPTGSAPLPKLPDVLAFHYGDDTDETLGQEGGVSQAAGLAFRLSHSMLETVRSSGNAVMERTIYSSDTEITAAIIDEHSPRAVMCMPLGDITEETVDLLYLDIPIDETTESTLDTFEFVKEVSKKIVRARKTLLHCQANAERSILDYQLSLAQKIRSGLMPAVPQDVDGVNLSLYYEPAIWVGGDYSDVWLVKDGRVMFAVGKVSDKGLPAALCMFSLWGILRAATSLAGELSGVMELVNDRLAPNLSGGKIIALFLGLFDPATGSLEYINAGHLQPIVLRGGTLAHLGQVDGPALGSEGGSFKKNVQELGKDIQLLVFTDGIINARSPSGEAFGMKQLEKLLKGADDRSAQSLKRLIMKAVEEFCFPYPLQDDITLFSLHT